MVERNQPQPHFFGVLLLVGDASAKSKRFRFVLCFFSYSATKIDMVAAMVLNYIHAWMQRSVTFLKWW